MRSLLLLALMSSCIPASVVDRARDRDRDGYDAWQLGGPDCDDAQATINPGTGEICGDGLDNDCNGAIDDDGTGASLWYPDADGDGFAADLPISACDRPMDYISTIEAGVDCDNADDSVHPGATEVWYDGVDQNCDGRDDFDQDGDGFASAAELSSGTDCDDLVDTVHPGVDETCGDHVDNDCDGGHNGCDLRGEFDLATVRASSLVVPKETEAPLLASVGDVDGNGLADVALRRYDGDTVYLFNAPLSALSTESDSDAVFAVPATPSLVAAAMTIQGDVNGDGRADLLTENHSESPDLRLYLAPFAPEYGIDDWDRRYLDLLDYHISRAGYLGDLDDDGVWSWVVTDVADDLSETHCFVVEGAPGNFMLDYVATASFSGPCQVVAVDDVNGDDTLELAQGTETGIRVGDGAATGDIYESPLSNVVFSESAPLRLSAIGDVNEDGKRDLGYVVSLGVNRSDGLGVALGPFGSSTAPTAEFDVEFPGFWVTRQDDAVFALVGPAVDMNGDGVDDLAFAKASLNTTTGDYQGALGVLYGPLPSSASNAHAWIELTPEDAISLVLTGTLAAGDVDGDGYDDLVFGGDQAAWVIYGQGR